MACVAEGFARVDVAQMDFNGRQVCGFQRIVQRNRRVAVGAEIADQPVGEPARLMDPVDEHALMVGLPKSISRSISAA